MTYSIWGRGVVEPSTVYRVSVTDEGRDALCRYHVAVRCGRTVVSTGNADSMCLAVRDAVARVRRYRTSGALSRSARLERWRLGAELRLDPKRQVSRRAL